MKISYDPEIDALYIRLWVILNRPVTLAESPLSRAFSLKFQETNFAVQTICGVSAAEAAGAGFSQLIVKPDAVALPTHQAPAFQLNAADTL